MTRRDMRLVFAHIHFASCEDSVNRLTKMGEQEFRIHNVGAPQRISLTPITQTNPDYWFTSV